MMIDTFGGFNPFLFRAYFVHGATQTRWLFVSFNPFLFRAYLVQMTIEYVGANGVFQSLSFQGLFGTNTD